MIQHGRERGVSGSALLSRRKIFHGHPALQKTGCGTRSAEDASTRDTDDEMGGRAGAIVMLAQDQPMFAPAIINSRRQAGGPAAR
jgi:hypothetical protein